MSLRIGDGWIHVYDRGFCNRTDRVCSICSGRTIWSLFDKYFGCIACNYISQGEDEQDVSEEEFEDLKQTTQFIKFTLEEIIPKRNP